MSIQYYFDNRDLDRVFQIFYKNRNISDRLSPKLKQLLSIWDKIINDMYDDRVFIDFIHENRGEFFINDVITQLILTHLVDQDLELVYEALHHYNDYLEFTEKHKEILNCIIGSVISNDHVRPKLFQKYSTGMEKFLLNKITYYNWGLWS